MVKMLATMYECFCKLVHERLMVRGYTQAASIYIVCVMAWDMWEQSYKLSHSIYLHDNVLLQAVHRRDQSEIATQAGTK
jgi:hypothetical protein